MVPRERHTNASHVYIHPDFDLDTLSADISIVVVSGRVFSCAPSEPSGTVTIIARFPSAPQLTTPLSVNKYAALANSFEPPDGDKTEALTCTLVAQSRNRPYRHFAVQVVYGPGACRKPIE